MIVDMASSGYAMKIRGVVGGIIAYADDTTIITETKEQMHKAIERILSTASST